MAADLSADLKDIMARNYENLAAYARRVILRGESLTDDEDEDRSVRLQEFFGIGTSFECTKKDLVTMLFREVFETRRSRRAGHGSTPARTYFVAPDRIEAERLSNYLKMARRHCRRNHRSAHASCNTPR